MTDSILGGQNKQRGIYSEVINPDNSILYNDISMLGPDNSMLIITQPRQKVPKAMTLNTSIRSVGSLNQTSSIGGKQGPKPNVLGLKPQPKQEWDPTVPTVDPKVLETFDPIPGRVPRKVQIDRQKKEYASFNLEDLLISQGVDFNTRNPSVEWLQLEYFDDEKFDDYSGDEWIQKMVDEDGVKRILTAKGLYKDAAGYYDWRPIQILAFDRKTNMYNGRWRGTSEEVKIHRLFFCLDAEDPRKFAKRVANAFLMRSYADSTVRYNFYVDNMPLQDLSELDTEQKKRLESLAKTKQLESTETTTLIIQVNNDYSRTMNKIIFDKFIDQYDSQSNELYPSHLTLPPKPPEKEAPHFGMMQLERYNGKKLVWMWNPKEITVEEPKDFTETFKDFCFSSLYIKEEVIKALQEVKVECNQVEQMEMFQEQALNPDQGNPMVLEQFKHIQESAVSQILYHLKGGWISELTKIIQNNFSLVGKGWFNMKETSKITYDFGKLKRFLTVVRLNMQDTVLTLVRRCFNSFHDKILKLLPKQVVITSATQFQNVWEGREKPVRPLFMFDLVKNNNDTEFLYSVRPQNFVYMVIHIFQKCLEQMAKIPDLEPKILADLYKATKNEAYIKTPVKPRQKPIMPDPNERPKKYPDENKWIWDLIESLREHLTNALKPLDQYLVAFGEFKDILRMDPDKKITDIEMDDNPWEVEKIQDEIKQVQEKERLLKNSVPESVQISVFQINTNEILGYLCEKYYSYSQSLIDMIAKRAKQSTHSIFNQFNAISNQVKQVPTDIEKLTEIREYMNNQLPTQLEKLQVEMNKCFEVYQILEDFNYRFSKEDMDKRWMIFGSPKDMMGVVEKRQKELEKEAVKFQDTMKVEQEDFKDRMENLKRTIAGFHQYQEISQHDQVAQTVKDINNALIEFQELVKKFNSREALFDHETTNYDELNTMTREFLPYSNLWLTVDNWYKNQQSWYNDEWDKLDAVGAEKFVQDANSKLSGCIRFFKDREIEPVMKIAKIIKAEVDEFQPKVPLMVALRKAGMKDRHWKLVSDKVGKDCKPKPEGFTFTTLLELGCMQYVDECVEIGERAAQEFNIENMLSDMKNIWENINFQIIPYKTSAIIRGYDEIQIVLDEHIINTQAMQFSPFKKPFEAEIIQWNNSLKTMSDVLEEWSKCQGEWMYLQPIFDSADIAKQLPTETKKFQTVDSTWKHTMNQAKTLVQVLQVCTQEGLYERLQEANKNLEIIQKELNNYLEKKREKFARFYFLSNNDLLEILSQTKEPTAVQPHLKKVFENVHQIEFDAGKKIHAMFSEEKERVGFVKPLDPNKKNVEDWMGEVEDMMRMSVRAALLRSVQEYPNTQRTTWVVSHPGQCVLNGSQIVWTRQVEDSFQNGVKGVKEYWDLLEKQLIDLVELVRTKLTKQAKVTVNALIVIDVHAKDVVEKLFKNNISDRTAFEWISQLRYNWEQDNCFVKCVQTSFPYGYEYLGNTLRLVITPLTDKCYMTLMGALKLNLGGAPAGPAGTGKTESVKDLAKALAKQCVVFNCSDSMDYIMIGKFFQGLASAGAWCCFDEFNRINIEVLSVIAQQLLILFGEKAKGTPVIQFEGSVIKILPTFNVYITMNPGYAGRTELPDNLKALFRPMAMMVPDYGMIGEIMLYSFGFSQGRELALKMVATFQLSSEQLSSQDHYDYGMRAVRSVINAAGLLKAAEPDLDEEKLLLRALRDVNVPKFLKDDLPLFENIIKDLFPGVEKPKVDYGLLLNQLNLTCNQMNLQHTPAFIAKVIQLYDTIQVRHGLMLVGPTGGGQTCNYQVLQKAMTTLSNEGFAKVYTHILNPKSITMGQLYGQFNEQTHEWTDGILAFRVRECCRDQSTDKQWVMFDGPVDAIWIQSMNTVLDDNKKLCLNSGQILTLTAQMTMMFQVEDLLVASPATVSRCGMIYMEPESLGFDPIIVSWMNSIPLNIKQFKQISAKLKKLSNTYIEDSLTFLRRSGIKETVTSQNNNLVASLQRILDSIFVNYAETEIQKVPNDELDSLQSMIEPLFFFALTWSIGCTGDDEGRQQFNVFLRQKMKQNGEKLLYPEEQTIYDYEFSIEEKIYILWDERNLKFAVDPKLGYHEAMIPTADSTRNIFLMKLLMMNSKHVLCPGPTGTGKTLNIFTMLTKELNQNYQYISLTYSAQTTANQTQDTIDAKLDKRRKGIYGPPIGQQYIIFIDDFNMPKKEQYGAQPPIELVRQFLDHQGWYNRQDLFFMKLEDIIVLSSMGPPGGGRTFITNRVVRHFNVLGYTELSQDTIKTIFSILLGHFLKRHNEPVKNLVNSTVDSILIVYNTIKNDLLPTPSKSHYTFNLRDIWKVVQGISTTQPQSIPDSNNLIRLWYHENMRVFHDRLTTPEDRVYLHNLLIGHFGTTFGMTDQNPETTIMDVERIIFADFMQGRDTDPKFYSQVMDLDQLLNRMDVYQEEFNSDTTFVFGGSKKPMKLVMFLDACEHISRIARIIRQPQGNALVLGVGGSGRQSLARMATFLTNYKIFQIEVIKNYTMRSWRDDVKQVLMYAGVENKPISFLFCDTQILKEQMMEDINNVLNSGDVTGIYQEKDYEDIVSACQSECVRKNIPPTKINVFTQYLARVKKNIHMIIAMSPIGDAFRTRLRMFPSLVNGCTIDWFTEWPEEALLGVGRGQLIDYEEDLGIQGQVPTFVEVFQSIHKSVEQISVRYLQELRRHVYVTPTSYLELLTMFKTILAEKQKEVQMSIERLILGLTKLEDANKSVEQLRLVLKEMQPELEKASIETEKMMEHLKIQKAEADLTQKTVAVEEAEATKGEMEARSMAAECEASVADATRKLDQTLAEVSQLRKEHLVEIKNFTAPANAVKVTLAGVVILNMTSIKQQGGNYIFMPTQDGKGKVENWFEMAQKYLLNDTRELLEMLMSYDKDNIQAGDIQQLEEKVLGNPDFNFPAVERCSYACKFLYLWCQAMVDYYKVFTETKPLRDKLIQVRKIVEVKQAELRIKKDELDRVNKKIKELEDTFAEKVAEKSKFL